MIIYFVMIVTDGRLKLNIYPITIVGVAENGTDLYSDPIVDIRSSQGIQHLKQMCSLSAVSTGMGWQGTAAPCSCEVNLLVIISDYIKSMRHDGQCPLKNACHTAP